MNEQCVPIVIDQGATFTWPITYLEADKTPVDLSGYTAKMQIRETVGSSGSAILDLTTENGGITITPATGVILVLVSGSTSGTLPAPFEGKYDLLLYSTSGLIEKLIGGPAKIQPVVTR